jgi:O-antigen/teichoic acid export membrane protein
MQISKQNIQKLTLFLDQGLVSGVNFLMGIMLTRFLGISNYGLFALGWILVLVMSSIQQAVIIAPMYKLFPEKKQISEYLRGLLGIQIYFSLFAVLISFIAIKVGVLFNASWDIPGIGFLLPAIVGLYCLHDFLRRRNFTLNLSESTLKMDMITYGLQIPMVYALHHFELLSLTTVLWVWFILLILGILVALRPKDISFGKYGISQIIVEHWAYSKHLFWTAILQWCSGNFFILVAGASLGTSAVGIIRIAQNIVGVLHVLFLALENLIPIQAAKVYFSQKWQGLLLFFKQVMFRFGLISLLLLGIIAFFRKELIEFLYGVEYIQYAHILLQFTVLYILVFTGTILRFFIRTIAVNKIIFQAYILTSVCSLLTASPLIDKYGIQGVVIGFFMTQLLMLIYYTIKILRYANHTHYNR